MGVHGLWRLIEPSGKPVALETLENKILAVDVSIWLHQAVKGFQDSKGAPVPNAHLLGIYHRVCKLLYFKIKPVFIFDGGVPVLKKQTIAKRNQQKSRNVSEAERLQKQLLSTLLKHSAISKVLSEKTKAALALPPIRTTKNEDMYVLPTPEMDSTISSSEEEETESTTDTTDSSPTKHWDLHTIDMSSSNFRSLPADVKHEILTELKETRKQSSWGRLHELPKQSDDFASYQMKRLLKRQAVQSALEDAEKEMGGHSLSLAELESILKDHGVATTNDIGKRIASDENTRYLYIKDVKQALEKARKEQMKLESIREENGTEDNTTTTTTSDKKAKTKADLEFEENLEKAIALSLQEEPSTSKTGDVSSSSDIRSNKPQCSFLDNFNDGDFESDTSDEVEDVPVVAKKFSSAASYMIEYSGLTPNEINKILNKKNSSEASSKIKKGLKNTKKEITDDKTCVVSTSELKRSAAVNNLQDSSTDITQQNIVNQSTSTNNRSESLEVKEIEANQVEGNENCSNTLLLDNTARSVTGSVDTTNINLLRSNSDASSDDEFEEVNDDTKNKDSLEIVIDPNQKLEDDLFSDVFKKEEMEEAATLESDNLNSSQENEGEEVTRTVSDTSSLEIKMTGRKSPVEDLETFTSDQKEMKSADTGVKETGVPEEVSMIQKNIEAETQKLNLEQMTELRDKLQKEKIDILVEKSTKERMASNITDQMYQEAQDLLELFGVPYIVAPMEAEAQCAFLDAVELTDGTITDDSDIWLFGGRTVYKNFFNQSKYVMEFKAENIKHHFKLTREQMVLLALLVGSDYTVGVQGVGPVTALEILAAFPPQEPKEFSLSHAELLSGLKEFRSWLTKEKSGGPSRSTLKNKLKNITFTDNFPSLQVIQAYLEPTVETSRETFSWSKPDFVGLTDFAKEKFGWGTRKTEEILKPVIKKVEETQAQKTMKDYFKTVFKADSTDVQNQMSKRVKKAVNRIGKSPEELIAEEMEALSKANQKRTRSKRDKTNKKGNTGDSKTKGEEVQEKAKRPRKKKVESSETSNKPSNVGERSECINVEEPKPKKPRTRKKDMTEKNTETITENSKETDQVDDNSDLKNIALELRKRRQRRNELPKRDTTVFNKTKKPPPEKTLPLEVVPEALEVDEEIRLLQATTSRSLKRVEEIDQEVKSQFEAKRQCLPNVHKREVIHQRLREKSDLLKNKLKAIEVFRKSKKGPGYVPKRGKKNAMVKKDAELSENSSSDG